MVFCPQLIIFLIFAIVHIISLMYYLFILDNTPSSNILSTLHIKNTKLLSIFSTVMFDIIMLFIFYLLCEHNHNSIAWIVLLLPTTLKFILLILIIIYLFKKIDNKIITKKLSE